MQSTKIFISGDFYGGSRAGSRLETKFRAGEFESVFGKFTDIIRSSDIAVTNLESPVINSGTPIVKTGPLLKAPPVALDALKFAGFNVVTLANNHILDYGLHGLEETVKELNKAGIRYVGASTESAKVRAPFIKEVNSKRIALLNFAENEWATLADSNAGANPLNPIANHYDIAEARKNADYVIVALHGGNEYHNLPNPRTKEVCRFYADSGADLVVCHHAHCYTGYEDYHNSKIYYGLGNFLFDVPNHKDPLWYLGIAVQVELKPDGSVAHTLLPYKQCKNFAGLELLSAEEHAEFEKNITELNAIIQDDAKLKSSFDTFIARKQKQYEAFLQPYSGKFRTLFKKKLLPPILNDTYFTLLLNLIRCESHRDVITNILSKKVPAEGGKQK